ncbi:hypothetical protein ABZ345_44415 [Lentzea sp. NPDC005914]|uniref:hypothetical protein n=1 Tax=Lentzea sp. NPDC005914 TaxID=3154572 RepID=UPI003400F1DB
MSNVPLWVTYSLAVIAILGPIGGALFGAWMTARRDDKRWQLEHDREERAWTREQEQRVHDARMTAYAEALLRAQQWHHELEAYQAYLYNPDDERRPDRAAFPGLELAARNGLVGVDLVGTEEVAADLRDLIVNLKQWFYRLESMHEFASQTQHYYGNEVDSTDADNALDALRTRMRSEATKVNDLAVTPTRSSGSTS